jgi:putative LysE/RhtB family amino acid efflux pump
VAKAFAILSAMSSIIIGFGLGFLVALQLGPMSLLLIRSTLRSGVIVGLSIGAGVAVIDAIYASLGAAGAASVLTFDALRLTFGLLGAAVLVWLGYKSLMAAVRVRAGFEVAADVATPRRAFLTSLGATASNPATIVSWAAIFTAASTTSDTSAVPLVMGVGLGSLTWMSLLATIVAVARKAAGPRTIRAVDGIAGVGLMGFGGALGYRTMRNN